MHEPVKLTVLGAGGEGVCPQPLPQEKCQGPTESAVTVITRRDILALSY